MSSSEAGNHVSYKIFTFLKIYIFPLSLENAFLTAFWFANLESVSGTLVHAPHGHHPYIMKACPCDKAHLHSLGVPRDYIQDCIVHIL